MADNEPSFDELVEQLDQVGIQTPEVAVVPAPLAPEVAPSQAEVDTGSTESTVDDTAPEVAPKISAKTAAEALGISPSEFYARLEITDGQTLGDFKDNAKDLRRAQELLAQARETRLNTENDLLAKTQAVRLAQQELGVPVTEAQLERSKAQAVEWQAQQARIAVEFMPEWQDEAVKHTDMAIIAKVLSDGGLSEAEQLMILDARLLFLFRRLGRYDAEIREVAKHKVTTTGQKPKPRTVPGGNVTNIAEQVKSGSMSQDAAARALGKLLG